MNKGDRKAADRVPTPEVGGRAKPPRMGRIPQYESLSVDGLARTMGGRAKFMNLARLCRDERVRAVVARWDALHVSKQSKKSIDAIVDECGLEASWLVGKVAETCHANGVETTKMMMAVSTPAVLSKNIELAMQDDHFKDRELYLKGAGFLPTPQAPQNNFAFLLANGMVPAVESSDEDTPKQIGGTSEIPRVEDHNVIDAVFRDLDGAEEAVVESGRD